MKLPARIAFGTMHGKAAAVQPPLRPLGIRLVVPQPFDTDRFGTFTPEVARTGSMLDAARAKARAAAAATGLPVALASEGSYGPHPLMPMLPLGRELLLWHEADTGREIAVWRVDEAPVYDHVLIGASDALGPFLQAVGFPATALIVVAAGHDGPPVAKGLAARDDLARAVTRAVALSPQGRALVQTDMRAHCNPRRQGTIRRLAEDLAARLGCACPQCRAAGWGVLRQTAGLPCGDCGAPTALALARVLGCTACGHEVEEPAMGGPAAADPAHCPLCNP